MAFLEIKDVIKNYGDYVAVQDVSISIPAGTVCTLLGPSGCGKTTTLRCIAGLEDADAGTITLDGSVLSAPAQCVFTPPEKRGLGMVFQSYALWPHKTVYENLALGLRISGKPKGEIDDKVREVLEIVGMAGVEKRHPTQMSGGQQQRVAVARALALEPKCLLFDEPLSNLDVLLRDRMRFEIRELLMKQKITAVYVTHDQTEAMVISDQICVMNKGRLVEQGTPSELYDRPSSRFVAEFFGRTNLMSLDRKASDPEKGFVVTSGGVRLNSRDAARLPQMEGETSIALRPEAIRIVDAGDTGAIEAKVLTCAHLGPNTDVELEISGHRVTALVAGRFRAEPGKRVGISVDPDDVMLLNRD